jgi:TPP-dependent pyruvate/acetoin dehydrogenase alpha subunit
VTQNSIKGSDQVSLVELADLYRSMLRIRRFEETVLGEFSRGYFFGTTHTYVGQEANAVGVLQNINTEDIVVSNHRSHGHFLAYGGDMHALFAELMGKATGVCGGRGGSQHLHWKNFYTVTITFLGDGALGEGVLYESLNMASLWSAPILFVLENNHIAQTTPAELNLAGNIAKRFKAFGIDCEDLDTSDVLMIKSSAARAIFEVREKSSPQVLILNTCRFGPHSKGDDTRPENEILDLRKNRDPISILSEHLEPEQIKPIEEEVDDEVKQAFQKAESDPIPD